MRSSSIGLLTAFALIAGLQSGCSTFSPQPIDQVPFRDRVETQERDGLTVSVTVLSQKESKEIFGIDIYDEGIQPIWARIENDTDVPYWFMLHGVDPNYFSAREAAYKSHFMLRGWSNRKMDDHFESLGIVPAVPPRGSTTGFVFSHVKLGTKEIRIQLLAENTVERFHFYVSVPGFRADHDAVDWRSVARDTDIIELDTDEELLEMVEQLPCCTTRKNGTGDGDPLNLVIIAPAHALLAFVRAGWDETEVLSLSSGWKTFKAFFGGEYKYSPMSALYYNRQPQHVGLQKARDTIHERNHLRLWITPWRYKGDFVLVGTITRDIGVYFTTRAWNLTTHAIDPMVDEARTYLVEDLITAESVKTFGTAGGIGAATKEHPHYNLMMAPFWTDGRRAIIRLVKREDRVPIDEIGYFSFHKPGQAITKFKGMQLEGGTLHEPDAAGSETDGTNAEPDADDTP